MAESSRRFRKSTSRSIAASSAIALALGGFSVVGPGPLAPHAAAATLSGGIREKSGAVEVGAQQASDLPAGSCVVKSEELSGSQAGFSWDHLEPSGTSPSKTLWGLSVSFDNSKDRTFADWYFSNSGNLSNVLDAGQVSSMEAGQTFNDDKDVTRKADESIEISAFGRTQRNLNLYAELTDEKVKQFASATANNPVRYAWQSNYKKDNPSGLKATEGDAATFGATVNPWPSENIECNPITVSWGTAEVSEKHVIVPGEETKVGTINVPAVKSGGTDDSMSRMVVEAYDGNGKFIGTTDPEASGGEQLLRIDEATGDIFFTWPEYRGTDLATDKNVNFSVLAKPRTVGQLQAATEHNTEGGNGKAFDSSNSLTRYNTANVIDSTSFSLDDTEYHDPKYDKTDASIISGVDSATGPLATEPQKVTFTQTPDLIKELAKKKDQQGFEAKATLDEKYVYEGWTVEMDEDYNVTVSAPENPRPGTFARPKVIVEYSNGSTDELELLVVVDPNNTQVTDLVRPGLTKGTIGDDLTAQVGTKSIMKGYKPVHPAKFEIDKSTVPEGWTVTVDDTGKVTAKADDTVAPGTIITPTVKATYPDDTTDEIETQFQAIVDIKVPTYDTVANKPGTDVSLTPTVPERGLSGNTTDEAPTRYTFENNKTELTVEDEAGTWTVKIDENTGEITTSIPRTAPEGHVLNIPVLAYYSDEKPQQVKGTVVVLKGDIAPVYSVESTGPNKAVDHQVQDAPVGSTFSFGTKSDGSPLTEMTTDDGWKYTIDPKTGVVTSTPPAGSKPGDKKTITVDVVTPSGATPKVPVTTVVQLTNSWEAEPNYPSETVYPGETATSPLTIQKPDGVEVAKETPYAIQPAEGYKATGDNNEFGNPTYTVTTKNGDWIVGLDDNGNVVATAPETAKPGDTVNVPVKVTYSDDSTDTVTAPIVVEDNPTRPVPFDVEYKYDPKVPAGEYRVETEGKPGEEKQNQDGKWEQTTAPTNEVVVVGTKPAENTQDLEWTVSIPYSTTLRENKALAPGEIRVVQNGVNGERNYTAIFRSVGDESYVVTSDDVKEPVEEIIEYGPGIQDQTLTSTTTNPVPFNTTFVADPNLPAGEQVVEKQGVNGVDTVTATQEIKDGKPVGEPTITTERTTEPVDAVVRVGTKTEGQTVNTYEAAIPFPVRVVYDPNLAPGESKVTQEGKPGTKKVTITQPVVNSAANGEATVAEETVTEPTEQIVTVGTKPDEATNTATWTVDVPFQTVVRANPELKPGEVKTIQEGEYGEKKFTADFSSVGSNSKVDTKEEQTKEPKDQIIEYGPTIDDQTLTSETTRPIEFVTEYVLDESLPAGEQKVDQQGENGEEKITSTQEIKDGKPVGEPTISTEVTKPAKKAIIRVGTKPTTTTATATATTEIATTVPTTVPTTVEKTTTQQVPTTVKETETKSVPTTITTTLTSTEKVPTTISGTPTTITETKAVPTTITTQVPTTVPTTVKETATETATATVTPAPVTTTVTKEPEPVNASETVKLPFTTKIIFDPTLEPGQKVEDVKGVDGEVKVTFTDGKATAETVKEPVQRVVRVGSKPAEGVEWTEEVAYDVKVEEDPNLEAGKYVVAQQGKPGQTVHKTDGTVETTEPTDHIIKVGTKNADSVDSEFKSPIPAPVVIQYDPNLPAGTVQDDPANPGVDGEKTVTVTRKMVNGQPVGEPVVTEKVTTEPQPRIVKVGTKQPTAGEQVTWTEPIPFQTTFRKNPDLAPGETRVVQEGQDGEATYYVEFKANGESATVENTNQRVEPVERIVEYGPRANDDEISTQLTRPIEFKTSVIYDDTLEEGKQVITQGELGEEVVTTTQKLVDGKPSGDPVTTTEVTKAPVNAVIRIGTKKPGTPDPEPEVSEVVDLPFTTKIVYDPTLEPGQEIEDVAGANGQVKVTVVNGKATVETVKEPVQRVVRVGSKPADAEWTEEIPFKVQVRENPELTREQSRIAQQGVPGLKKVVNGNEQVVREPVDYILEVGTKEPEAEKPRYSPVALQPGQTANIQPTNGVKGNKYRKLDWPKGWEGSVDPETGELQVTTPADAKPGDKANLPVEVTDENGNTYTVYTEVIVSGQDVVPVPDADKGSSEKAERCVANAFSANSPFLWLLPLGILGAIGYGVNEAFGPQIQQASAQFNEAIRRNTPDFGIGRGVEQPEWMRQINAQVDAINRQFAPVAKQLEPIGIALGAIAAISMFGVLIAQACTEEGFDEGLTILSSKK